MADPELVEYLRTQLKDFSAEALRAQTVKDGVSAADFEEALREARGAPTTIGGTMPKGAPTLPPRPKSKLALFAVAGGAILIIIAGILSMDKPAPPGPTPTQKDKGGDIPKVINGEIDDSGDVFRGHYGWMLRLPPDYKAHQTFRDAQKTHETVHFFPKGTSHQHFVNEGLYGSIGIIRLDATRRRVPQGFIGIDTLKTWVTNKLDREKSSYKMHDKIINGLPSFIVNVETPFKYTKAFIVGEEVRYEVTGGDENALFTSIVFSLYEASPHDRPGQ